MAEFNDILKLMQRHLKRDDGVFIGENHFEPFARTVLIEHMPALHALGVRSIYLELTQETVDALRAGGTDCVLLSVRDLGLKEYTSAPDEVAATADMRRSADLYGAIITRADALGIQVVGYDVFNESIDIGGALTAEGMDRRDREGADIIAQTRGADKYIVLGGSAHSRTKGSSKEIPSAGIDQRLDIAAIDFTPADDARSTHPDMRRIQASKEGQYAIAKARKSADHVIIHDTDYAADFIATSPHEPISVQRVTFVGASVDIAISRVGADLLANGLCHNANQYGGFKSDGEREALIARFTPKEDGPSR